MGFFKSPPTGHSVSNRRFTETGDLKSAEGEFSSINRNGNTSVIALNKLSTSIPETSELLQSFECWVGVGIFFTVLLLVLYHQSLV